MEELTYGLTFEDVIAIIRLLDAGRVEELRLETDGLDLEVVFRHESEESNDPGEPAPGGTARSEPLSLRPANAPDRVSPGPPAPLAEPGTGPAAAGGPAAETGPAAGAGPAAAGPGPANGTGPAAAPASAVPADAVAVTAPPDAAVAVTAPLDGVFYRAPSPGAPPFVEAGGRIGEGDRVGLIEVMKLFTPVVAACSGVVSEIRAENEQLVHSGQVLVVIAPVER